MGEISFYKQTLIDISTQSDKIPHFSMPAIISKYLAIILVVNSLISNALDHFSGIKGLSIYIFIAALFLLIFLSLIKGLFVDLRNNLELVFFLIIILSFFFLPFWTSYKNIIVCVGPLAAYFVLLNLNFEDIKKITLIFLIINLPIAIYEYFTVSYLYNVSGDTYGVEFEIIAYSDLMRSKGLFAICLGLGYFSAFSSFIFNDDIKIISISLILCLLAGSRQPLVMVMFAFIMYFVTYTSGKNIYFTLLIALTLVTLAALFLQEKSIDRILMTADFQNDSSNNLRIFFWLLGINTYFFEYDLFHQVFGNMGYFQEKIGYNAESAWITLLLDVGFIITLLYIILFAYISYRLLVLKKYKKLILLGMVFVSMWTVPLVYNYNQNLYFWMFMLLILKQQPQLKYPFLNKKDSFDYSSYSN